MEQTSQLYQWANTDVKKLLYDEWCAKIGSFVVAGDLETAKKLSDASLLVLKFTEEYLHENINLPELSVKLAASIISSKPDSISETSIEYYSKEKQSNNQPRKPIAMKTEDNFKKNERNERATTSQRPDFIPESQTPYKRKEISPPLPYKNTGSPNHTILICGKWPQVKRNENVRMMRFLEETPADIQKSLENHKLLNNSTKTIAIASNTRWIGRSVTVTSADQLYNLCEALHRRAPRALIKLVGFYSKNGAIHLENFNEYLKSIATELDYIKYVAFEELLSASEISRTAGKNRNLSEWTIVKMLERLAEH